MAEEDLIFGKNRHFFGGIEPSNMLAFSVAVETGVVKVTATLPNDTVVNDQTLCTVEGAIIRRKTTDYPKDEFDGDLVANIKASTVFNDSGASPTGTNYYAAFPYTTQGVYNRNKANRASIAQKKGDYLFGYDLFNTVYQPTYRVKYPSDVDNAKFTKAAMNFRTGEFDYGGWAFDPGEKFMPRPCMLTYDGKVDHYLNPNDYTKKVDGTESKVTDTSFDGNAMMEWPKIYTKRWESDGVYHFRCSDTPQDDTWDCWCNYDRNNNQIDQFYTPIYFGSLDTSQKLRSISCSDNSVNLLPDEEITYAKANGNDWYTEVLADRLLLQDLLVMMAGSTDCQAAFGNGRAIASNKDAIISGTMDTKGMFWGSTDRRLGVKVFGMENVWGNLSRYIAGWIVDCGTQKVKLTRGTHDGSTVTDYNTDGSGYKTIANATPVGDYGGYISNMKTEAFGRLPVIANGSSTTFETDIMWYNEIECCYALVGGAYNDDDVAIGPFYADVQHGLYESDSLFGAALSCKPLATA